MRAAWDAVVVSVVIVAVALIVAVVAVGSAVCWLVSMPFCRLPSRSSRKDFALWERQFDSGVHRVNPGTWGLAESIDPVRDMGVPDE